ncbi:unnamed protein product [Acanthosepion pharaonis]|uniref:Uncharacterized protein n=1 Tax=Acanthosepion pharaonis TaxID=158019 RepID=A0A812EG77_ACAPH|nr:unnamed protein product [Sepia pharaonis]
MCLYVCVDPLFVYLFYFLFVSLFSKRLLSYSLYSLRNLPLTRFFSSTLFFLSALLSYCLFSHSLLYSSPSHYFSRIPPLFTSLSFIFSPSMTLPSYLFRPSDCVLTNTPPPYPLLLLHSSEVSFSFLSLTLVLFSLTFKHFRYLLICSFCQRFFLLDSFFTRVPTTIFFFLFFLAFYLSSFHLANRKVFFTFSLFILFLSLKLQRFRHLSLFDWRLCFLLVLLYPPTTNIPFLLYYTFK